MKGARAEEAVVRRRVGVVGAGSWGTALACLLHRNGHEVRLWSHEAEIVNEILRDGENRTYLPGVSVDAGIRPSAVLSEVVEGAEIVVSVSPAQHAGAVMKGAAPHLAPGVIVVSASKGIQTETLETLDQVLQSVLPPFARDRVVILSGPSFAAEVARGEPTAVVVAGRSAEPMLAIQEAFRSEHFRVYTNPDVLGVELGGAVKNVVALAAGVLVGLGLGYNAQAALITRGLAEITRLATAMGAQPATMYGLAGMGDLVLTCTGPLSRNRSVGVRLGKGERIEQILGEMRAVAEGVRTAPAVRALARRHGVPMPIVEEVCAILEGTRDPQDAVRELMLRDPRPEVWE